MTAQRIEEYQIISTDTTGEMSNAVTKKLAEGWQPFGQLVLNSSNGRWAQALESRFVGFVLNSVDA